MKTRAVIQSIGHYLPEKRLTNAQLEQMVETSDEWIVQRTGIRERRICSDEEYTSTLHIGAAKEALANAGITSDELDLILCGTVTPDMSFPSTACFVHEAIGGSKAGAVDMAGACASFIYSLQMAGAMIEAGRAQTILVTGGDALSKFTDFQDRSTCVLFGDGAAGVVVKAETDTDRGIIDSVVLADGTGAKYIEVAVGGARHPSWDPKSKEFNPFIYMNGAEVYRFAVKAMADACNRVLAKAGMTAADVDLFVPHQANLRIIESSVKRLGIPDEKVFLNVHKYGNMGGGSIPVALYEAVQEGYLKKGMVVMTVGFGAGLVWGANLIRW